MKSLVLLVLVAFLASGVTAGRLGKKCSSDSDCCKKDGKMCSNGASEKKRKACVDTNYGKRCVRRQCGKEGFQKVGGKCYVAKKGKDACCKSFVDDKCGKELKDCNAAAGSSYAGPKSSNSQATSRGNGPDAQDDGGSSGSCKTEFKVTDISGMPGNGWVRSGDGMRFTDETRNPTDANSFTIKFKACEAGVWRIVNHAKKASNNCDWDKCNDFFMKCNKDSLRDNSDRGGGAKASGGSYHKAMAAPKGDESYSEQSRFNLEGPGHGNFPECDYQLSKGEELTVTFHGRSENLILQKFVFELQ